jgi:hypothetical protein
MKTMTMKGTAYVASPIRNSVGERVTASPAISQGSCFIRGAEHLFRIGL